MNFNNIGVSTYIIRKLSNKITELGIKCSRYMCKRFLKIFKLGKRKMNKILSLKEVENRNEQFQKIEQLKKEAQISNNPLISMDTKKKETLGNFYREGRCYCNEALKVYDHDFLTFGKGTIVPHGIYDVNKNIGYMTLSKSHDTSEFACDNIEYWWVTYGKNMYPNANCINILCDGGGSNSCRSFLFKEDLQNLVNRIGISIRIIHYPAYTSKHNPIEHKLFPHISRSLCGTLIGSIDTVFDKIKDITTSKGLKVYVHINDKEYEIKRNFI